MTTASPSPSSGKAAPSPNSPLTTRPRKTAGSSSASPTSSPPTASLAGTREASPGSPESPERPRTRPSPRRSGAAALVRPLPNHVVVRPARASIPRLRVRRPRPRDPSFEGTAWLYERACRAYPPFGVPRRGRSSDPRTRGSQALALRDAIRVEDRFHVPERGQERAQRLEVAHLRDVPVLRHLILDRAAVRDDVRAVLGERPGDVLEQPRPVPRIDRDLHAEALRGRTVPLDRREPLRIAHQRADVRAVAAVHRDPLAERDVADDLVAGHRCAALRQANENVLDADDVDAVRIARDRIPRARLLAREDSLLLRDLLDLQPLEHLVDDAPGGQLPGAEREVEVLGLLVAGLADHAREHGRAGELAVREALRLQRGLERIAALRLEVFLLLAREELPDLVARPGRRGEREPVTRRSAPALRREHLDPIAALQLVMKRNDAAVHLRADGAVADVGVHRIGEVDRRGARGQRLDLALGREDEHLFVEEIGAERLDELARIGLFLVHVHQLLHPVEPFLARLRAAVLVREPVSSDTELGRLVHLARTHLNLERPALGPDHRRVQRAIAVELRHGNVVLEPPRHRLPERMDQAERAVAVARSLFGVALDGDAHRGEVVDLVELAALLRHLVVDRVEVLRAPGDLCRDIDLLELAREHVRRLGDVTFAIGAALGDHRRDLLVLARVQRLEREILELPLDRVDAEPVRERRVDLERLLRLHDLLLLAQVLDRAHVVQPVRELDQDHADVLGHRDDHLAVVLGLRLLTALELDPRQLRNAFDEPRDLFAELGADILDRHLRVLDDVVQERGGKRLLVEPELRADPCGADGMLDEIGARAPLLSIVGGLCEPESAGHMLGVDRSAVLRYLGEQLVEEVLMLLSFCDSGHCFSVYSGPLRA